MRAFEIFEARQNYHGPDLVNKSDDPGWVMVIDSLNEEFNHSDLESFFQNYVSNPLYKNELKQGQSEIGDWFINAQLIPASKQSKLLIIISQLREIHDKSMFKKETTLEKINMGAIVFKNKEAAEEFAQLIKFRFQDEFNIGIQHEGI